MHHRREHTIFHPLPGRAHFRCDTIYGPKNLSAVRFAYGRAFTEPVQENENVRPTCGCIGDVHSGEGYCVNPAHLERVKVGPADMVTEVDADEVS